MRAFLVFCAALATLGAADALNPRQILDPSTPPSQSAGPPVSASQPPQPSNSAPSNNPSSPPQPSQQPSQPPQSQPSNHPEPSTQAPSLTSLPPTPTVIQSTDEGGSVVEVTITVSQSTASSSAEPSQSTTPKASKGISTGSIVGMSVAGGVALLGIVAFFIWKLTRKRFSEFDDNEAIKWPELNAHGESSENFAMPANQTARTGFVSESDVNLSRTASASTGYGVGADPYAVPPLPHANPNQPYRDDPGSAYYDPYRGPVPHTFSDATAPHDNDAIPMSSIRARSPGPAMAFDAGRSSPAPSMGRQSPGPHMAYASYSRTMSPGPNTAYGGYPH